MRLTNRAKNVCLYALFLISWDWAGAQSALAMNNWAQAPVYEGKILLPDLLRQMEKKKNISILFDASVVNNQMVERNSVVTDDDIFLQEELSKLGLKLEKVKENVFVVISTKKGAGENGQGLGTKSSKSDNRVLTGTIKDKAGEPLPGAIIYLKSNKRIGTTTGVDGSFRFVIPDSINNPVVIFSFIGYEPQEVVVGSQTSFEIVLEEISKSMNEVVVLGFAQSVSRRELSGSVSTIKAEDLARIPVSSFDLAIQGQAPGVQVTIASGTPGGAAKITIRGNTSVLASNGPLYVVDGVPLSVSNASYDNRIGESNQTVNPLNQINTSDIENIEILKDASATAIYGSRGANGVILITTKRGKEGKFNVNFSTYTGTSTVRKKLDVLRSVQFAEYYAEALRNVGSNTLPIDTFALNNNTDWQSEIFRTAIQTNYQLGIDGGTEKTKYYTSLSYFNQDGVVKNSGMERFTIRLNIEQRIKDNFKIGSNINLSKTLNNRSVRTERGIGSGGVILGALGQIPMLPVRYSDGTYGYNRLKYFDNPVGQLNETHINANLYQILGNQYAEWNLLPNLTYRPSIAYEVKNQKEDSYYSTLLPSTQNAPDPSVKGRAQTATRFEYTTTLENTFLYKMKAGEGSNFNFLFSNVYQKYNEEVSYADKQTFSSDAVQNLGAAATLNSAYSYSNKWIINSYLARVLYSYKERYSATLSGRYDGSSRFLGKNRYGFFPSGSVAWNLSNESFFPKTRFAELLKIRASLGVTGNQDGIPLYGGYSTFAFNGAYPSAGGTIGSGVTPNTLGNENLKWEATTQTDIGVDYGLLNGNLNLTFDLYMKRTSNLLYNLPLPPSAGYSSGSIAANIGSVENKGIELGITSTNFSRDNFRWTTNFNYSVNRNKVLDLGQSIDADGNVVDNQQQLGNNILKVGQPIGAFYGYAMEGIFQNQEDINNSAVIGNDKTKVHPGDVKYRDMNADGKIDEKDLTILGNPNPKFLAGITNTFDFYGFDATIFLQGSFGNDIFALYKQQTEGMNDAINQETTVLGRWTPTNPSNTMPRAAFGNNNNNQASSRFVYDGTYVRVRNITIGYSLPKSSLTKFRIKSFRIYGSLQNWFTFTDYPGFDPEVSSNGLSATQSGIDYGSYPQAKTAIIGLNVTF